MRRSIAASRTGWPEIERELAEAGARRLQIASEQDRLANLERAWDHWNELISGEQRLADLPAVKTFPENGVIRLEMLETQAETARDELSAAGERVQRIRVSVDEDIEHLTILEKSSEVRALERERGAFDQSVKDLPERRSELASKRSELYTSLANLGAGWDTERLDEVRPLAGGAGGGCRPR